MTTIENFLFQFEGQQKTILAFLDELLSHEFGLISKIKWKIPTYHRRSIICYLNPIKKNGIELAFFRGNELSNDQKLLADKGRKLVAGVDIYDIHQVPLRQIKEIINEAIVLDDLRTK